MVCLAHTRLDSKGHQAGMTTFTSKHNRQSCSSHYFVLYNIQQDCVKLHIVSHPVHALQKWAVLQAHPGPNIWSTGRMQTQAIPKPQVPVDEQSVDRWLLCTATFDNTHL